MINKLGVELLRSVIQKGYNNIKLENINNVHIIHK